MKVGDLVQSMGDSRLVGIVTAIGHTGEFADIVNCPWVNPDIHVFTANGKKLWSYRVLEVVSESRQSR